MDYVTEPERKVPVAGEYDVVLPQGIDNLLVAGRCASMTHDGQSAARVSGGCFVMGQAAGTAAALALKGGVAPCALDVARLQAQLRRDGAFLGDENPRGNAPAAGVKPA